MARSSTQFLAHHHAGRICHYHWYLCRILVHSKPIQSRFSMVSPAHRKFAPPYVPFPKADNHPYNRLFPYSVATGSLGIIFILIILGLIAQRQLLPGIVMLGSFILFVLFLTGLIETSIQLYGPTGSVNSYCNIYTPSKGYTSGQGEATLAYLETQGICNDWKAVFSFYIVGSVFLLWMMVMSYQVNRDDFE